LPNIPLFPRNKAPEVFQGKVLHTMDYSVLDENSAYELIKGKRVVVIGSQKSALDFAVDCAEANRGMFIHITDIIQVGFPFIQFNCYWAINGFSLILGRRR
jgi:dimethylaniline monooxygenase (N-oxide forming)